MLRKVLGSLALTLGLLAFFVSALVFLSAEKIEVEPGADPAEWLAHLQRAVAIYFVFGLAVIGGAVLVLARRPVGALLLACAFAFVGIAPWVISAMGRSRFSFEVPNLVETILYMGGAVFCLVIYVHRD